jgi:hypothetical protein
MTTTRRIAAGSEIAEADTWDLTHLFNEEDDRAAFSELSEDGSASCAIF